MQNKRYSIEIELTGLTGKKTAEVLSKIFENPIDYNNSSGEYIVKDEFDRDWLVGNADDITCQRNNNGRIVGANYLFSVKLKTPMLNQKDFEVFETVLNDLEKVGAITNDSTKLKINLRMPEYTLNYWQNISNIMESKGDLIYKAVQSNNQKPPDITKLYEKSVIQFPMFNSSLDIDKIKSCLQLSQAINNQALTQNRVSPKKSNSPNEKFTFRTWLIRLGMIGDEYKTTRSVLMENLEGNTAWKNPEMANKQKENTEICNEVEIAENIQQDEQELETIEEPHDGMDMLM